MSLSSAESVVQVTELCSSYGDRLILDRVSMDVRDREIMVIAGGSGCGKTTLLKSIVGLVQPASGQVSIFGQEVTQLDEDAFAELLRQIGVMFQYGALLGSLTVGENVALPLQMHTGLSDALIEEIVRMKLHLVELDGAFSLLPSELSGGMRKRAALARAMALDPKILFCDEPGAGLDPVTALGIDRLLVKLNSDLNTTIAVVTHELQSIQRIAHRITMLCEGQVLFAGGLEEARHSGNRKIEQFFLQEGACP